jgi:hypothetical protein
VAHAKKLSVILWAIDAAVENLYPVNQPVSRQEDPANCPPAPSKTETIPARQERTRGQIEICAAGRHSAQSEMDGDNIVNHHHSRHIFPRPPEWMGNTAHRRMERPKTLRQREEAPSANAIRILSRRCTCLPPIFPDKQDQVGRNLPAETSGTYGFSIDRPSFAHSTASLTASAGKSQIK